jgi:hypothetical protein
MSKTYVLKENNEKNKKQPNVVKTKYGQASMYKNHPVTERDTMIILNRDEKREYSMKKENN